MLLGKRSTAPHHVSTTGLSPTPVRHPNLFVYTLRQLRCTAVQHEPLPTTPTTQPLPGITRDRFSLIRVRSPLLTESLLFSLPAGTEMFHFPTFPPTGLYIQPAVTPTPESVHAWFPHSDILGSPFGYQLPQAYRRFPRPSSAPTTKASTVRSCKLTQPTTPTRHCWPNKPTQQIQHHTHHNQPVEHVAALSHEYNQTPHHNQQLRHGTQN